MTSLSQGVEYNITVYGRNLTCTSYKGEKATLLMTLDGIHAYIVIILLLLCLYYIVPEQVISLSAVSLLEENVLATWQVVHSLMC